MNFDPFGDPFKVGISGGADLFALRNRFRGGARSPRKAEQPAEAGDAFTFESGATQGAMELEQRVITWRKTWYQVTREKGLVLPALTNFIRICELAKDVKAEKPKGHLVIC